MSVFFFPSNICICPEHSGCFQLAQVADQSSAFLYPPYGIIANSPSNAFHSTTSAAFQQQPAYDQMAAAAAAAANGQDYYQHQHQQPMIYMPPVPHNPPSNPMQPTVVDHVHAQPATVADASPESQSVSPGREASSAPTARNLNNSKRAEQNRKAQRAFRERRDAYVLSPYEPPLQIPTRTTVSLFANFSNAGTSNTSNHALISSMPPCSKRRNPIAAGRRHEG